MRLGAAHFVFLVASASITSCAPSKKNETTGTSAIADTPENKPFGDIDRNAIDTSVSPCADFYSYACGGWTKTARIPDDEGSWTRGFSEARAHDEEILRTILERDAVDPPADDPYSAQLGDFFASCMDETAITARGDGELTALLDRVSTSDPDSLAKTIADLHLLGVPALFVLEPEADLHDSRRVVAVLRQPPLVDPMDAIEVRLSAALESHAVFHDPKTAPTIVDANGLLKISANFRWKTYFAELGISSPSIVHVATPNYFSALDRILVTTKSDALASTLRQELRHSLEQNFSAPGARTLPSRKQFCVRSADALLGDALAVPFARAALHENDVANARTQADAMRDATQKEIDALTWMDEVTGRAAKKKVAALSMSIGIAAGKPLYGDFSLGRASFLRDVLRLRKIVAEKKLATIGRATDSSAWRFPATTANAYFDPRMNEMVIAAGMMVPPIFDGRDPWSFAFDDIVGHELTHALDRRFDENGNAADWWSAQTTEQYRERVECVRRDLDAQSMILKTDLRVSQILDESVADSGGLRLAYRRMSIERSSNGTARDQAFFTAYAQLWCTELRPEALANYVAENPHAPPRVRVNRALADMPELANAFSCKDGDAMFKKLADRCDVW